MAKNLNMLDGKRRESAAQHVENQDRYDYERWDAHLSAIFTQLGIVRAISEGGLTGDEQARAIAANNSDWSFILESYPEDERASLQKNLLAATYDAKAAKELLTSLAELARYTGQQVRTLAPAHSERQKEDTERHERRDTLHPTHAFLEGKESEMIAEDLASIIEAVKEKRDTSIEAYYAIGHLQRLLAIVEKLREKIEDEAIPTGGRDADTCVTQISAARDMLVKALEPSKNDHDGRTVDQSKIDIATLEKAADIAGWLSPVKATSV